MNSEKLNKTLTRLRELAKAASVDQDTRSQLKAIMSEVERLPTKPAGGATSQTRLQRLEAMAVQFEVNHPTLGTALRELTELLAQAGV